ncbi:methyltransferase domain-containing protein [Actinokineospora sp. PR83]|uniref:methyltransferase domain-containing protein n=1 Tax=Actinokineospora sp. PR83 TaxID=2884908 RepID=UPI001F1CFEFA|nr:methyltransferase domain-containing protein [Actinokineospora sp. PR83]MCG8914369.1 methyltransferase domain-containing protein [Actinokineospora sp. PR83]
MTAPDPDWTPLARDLVHALVRGGHLSTREWVEAFAAVPRHVFTPVVIESTGGGYRTLADTPGERADWLRAVYSDTSLVTRQRPHRAGYTFPGGTPVQVSTSSSTMPSLMARMVEALDLRPGHRVLEIGTGTGYNAAILSHRLGADHVVSVDIDPDLVAEAARALDDLGYRPTLVAGDGTVGVPEHGPYDRILATAAVPDIPFAWVEQLAPGGRVLANVRGDIAGGSLCLLDKHGTADEVIGSFLPLGGHFMWVRPEVDNPHRPHEETANPVRVVAARTTTRSSDLLDLVDDESFRFLLQLQCPGLRTFIRNTAPGSGPAVVATASDGARAEVFAEAGDSVLRVSQGGPRRLWDTVEATGRLWRELGRPAADRFGVVVNASVRFVWFDDDSGWYRWPLPLV